MSARTRLPSLYMLMCAATISRNYPYRAGVQDGDEARLDTLDIEALIASYRPILHPQASAALLERRISSMRSSRDSFLSSRSSSGTTARSEPGPLTPAADAETRRSPEVESFRSNGAGAPSLRLSRSGSGQSVRFAASAISLHHDNASSSSVQTLPPKLSASDKSTSGMSKLSRKLSAASVQSGYMSLFSSSARRKAAAQAKKEEHSEATQHWMSGEIGSPSSPEPGSSIPDRDSTSLLERRPSALSSSSTRSSLEIQQRSYSSPGFTTSSFDLDRQRQYSSDDAVPAHHRTPLSAPLMAPSLSTPAYASHAPAAARSSLQSQPDSPRSSFSSSGKSSFRWSVGSSGGASSSSGRTTVSQSEYGPVLHIKLPDAAVQRPISTILEHEQDPAASSPGGSEESEDPSLAVGISEPIESNVSQTSTAGHRHQRQESGALDIYASRASSDAPHPLLSIPSFSNRRHRRARESIDSFDFDMEGRSVLVKDFPTPPVVSRQNSVDAAGGGHDGYFDAPAYMQTQSHGAPELPSRPRAASTSSASSVSAAPHPFSVMPAAYRRPSATSRPLGLPTVTAAPLSSPPAASSTMVTRSMSDTASMKSVHRAQRAMSADQATGQLALPVFTSAPLRRTPSSASIASRNTARLQNVHFSI